MVTRVVTFIFVTSRLGLRLIAELFTWGDLSYQRRRNFSKWLHPLLWTIELEIGSILSSLAGFVIIVLPRVLAVISCMQFPPCPRPPCGNYTATWRGAKIDNWKKRRNAHICFALGCFSKCFNHCCTVMCVCRPTLIYLVLSWPAVACLLTRWLYIERVCLTK